MTMTIPKPLPGGARFLTLGRPSSHIKRMEDPSNSFNSTVLLLRHIGGTHEWEITITGQGEKPMSRVTFRGSRREADDMAIRGRLAAEVKLEATARNDDCRRRHRRHRSRENPGAIERRQEPRPATGSARAKSEPRGVEIPIVFQAEELSEGFLGAFRESDE